MVPEHEASELFSIFRALTQNLTFNKSFDRTSSCLLLEALSTQEPHWSSQMIGTLWAGGARDTQHTHYTHERKRGCRHQGGTRHEGECKGEAAGRWLGPRKVSLNVLCRVRTQPKPKPTKQPLTLNTLSN